MRDGKIPEGQVQEAVGRQFRQGVVRKSRLGRMTTLRADQRKVEEQRAARGLSNNM